MSPQDAEKPEPRASLPAGSLPVNRLALTSGNSAPASPTRLVTGPGAAPPAVTATPDFRALLVALKRRWLLAAFVGLLVAGSVVALLLFLIPTKYVAYATLQVAFSQDTPSTKNAYRNDFPIYLKTQAARLRSRDILLKALGQEQVRSLSVIRGYPDTLSVLTWLEEYLKVDCQDSMELLTVSLPGEDPEELAVIVNAIANSYLSIINDRENSLRRERIRKMQALEGATKEKLMEKIAERQALYKGQATPDSAAEMQRHASLYAQKLDATREYWRLKGETDKHRGRLDAYRANQRNLTTAEVPESTINSLMQSDWAIRDKLVSLAKWEKNVEELVAAGHKPNDSTLLYAQRRLASLQKEVGSHREAIRIEQRETLKRKLEGEYALGLEQLQNELKPMEDQTAKMQEYVQQLTKETETIGIRNSKADLLNAEIKQQENKLETVAAQLKNLQFEEEADPRVSACHEAVWQIKDAKRRLILVIMIPVISFIAAALAVGWCECRARKIHTPADVETGLGLRVVGAVPSLPLGRQGRIGGALDFAPAAGHDVIESIDAIRTMLLRDAHVQTTRLVMVTSAVGGEGKTTLAANLAVSLARAGRRTLLVDCDLRRPAMHQLFEQTLAPGFSEVLLGEAALPDAIRPTTTDAHLWLLPAGHWDRAVVQELARERTATIFEQLKEEFDFVIVDTHPVLPAADSLLVGQHMDAVLVSVMRNLSRSPRVYAAYQRLTALGIRFVGAVVNGVHSDVVESGYAGSNRLQVA